MEKIKNIKLIIFDMDGLIFDSERVFMEKLSEVMAENEYTLTKERYINTIGLNGKPLEDKMKGWYGENYPFKEISLEARSRVNKIVEKGLMPVKDGIKELLEHIKSKNIACCVASSTPTKYVKDYLTAAGLIDYFKYVCGGESVKKSKPEPDIFLKACKDFNIESENALIFEDSQNGLIAADRAGIRVICIPDLKVPDEEVLKKAYCVLKNAYEAIDII